MRRFGLVIPFLAVLLLGPPLSRGALAAGPDSRQQAATIFGILPPVNHSASPVSGSPASGPLAYDGGPVMTTNRVYAIYWIPRGYTVSGNYETLINRFFGDLQTDSGKNANAYAAATQYYQQGPTGVTSYIQNRTTFAGSVLDSDPLPSLDAASCPDAAAPLNGTNGTPSTPASCVTDAQLRQELSSVIRANGWTVDGSSEFLVFTAKNIGSCAPAGVTVGTQLETTPACAFQSFCAYHGAYYDPTLNPNSQVIYADVPYAAETAGLPVTCDAGQYPNNDDADPTINLVSYVQNGTITDPFGTGWWSGSASGGETGDLCSFSFGQLQGSAGAEYTQTINGHHYLLQQEWDNTTNSCAQSETPRLTLTPNIGYPTAPFKVSALFFNAGESVQVSFTGASSLPESLGSATADASGRIERLMTAVPGDAQPETATVAAAGTSGASGSAAFTVPEN
jgi:hypothetical protein